MGGSTDSLWCLQKKNIAEEEEGGRGGGRGRRRRNGKKVGKGAGEEEVAPKNNTHSVEKQGYTYLRGIYHIYFVWILKCLRIRLLSGLVWFVHKHYLSAAKSPTNPHRKEEEGGTELTLAAPLLHLCLKMLHYFDVV